MKYDEKLMSKDRYDSSKALWGPGGFATPR